LLLVRLDGALARMAKSRYEYVKFFEKDDSLLQNTWIVVRIDGRGFHGYNHLPRSCLAALLMEIDSPELTISTNRMTSMLSIS
jgi:tRNAHis guanylyltransferase